MAKATVQARSCRTALKCSLVGLAASLVFPLAFSPAMAQTRYIRMTGWIQWIAGERLMLALDDGSGVVPVDLPACRSMSTGRSGVAVMPIWNAGSKYSRISRQLLSSRALPRWHSSTMMRSKKSSGY